LHKALHHGEDDAEDLLLEGEKKQGRQPFRGIAQYLAAHPAAEL